MKQIVQEFDTGDTKVIDTPIPLCKPGELLISTSSSLISVGTEKSLVEFGKSNLISKARSRPDKVEQVLSKLRTDGLLPTMEAVFSRLEEPLPLGYCNAGTVIEVGEGVTGFAVGDRVVSNGPHAGVVSVPKNLCARIPEGVSDDEAAFTVLASIALQGVRLAEPTLGERVAVLGLGLVGLLAVQLLKANGCQVIGTDFDQRKLSLAEEFGAEIVNLSKGEDPIQAGLSFSGGKGIDKVIIAAATESNDPVHQAAQMSRKRGKIVLVGVTGLDLKREDFYEKELTFQVSCSYGPGRYDPSYEEKGQDYPYGFVRWTEQRNFQAVLELMSGGELNVNPLIDERYSIEQAPKAYEHLLQDSSLLGVILSYPGRDEYKRTIQISKSVDFQKKEYKASAPVISMIGAGNFATRVLIPALKKTDAALHTIVSAGGTSAAVTGKKFDFIKASTDFVEILRNSEINTLFIATRHNLHANMVIEGLKAGKHVFVEKPLALERNELEQVKNAVMEHPDCHLMVGYNRRFSPLSIKMKELIDSRTQPLTMIYTVNAGSIPPDHWTQDPEIGGGRIIGEGCHFIDYLRFFTGSPIVAVTAKRIGDGAGCSVQDDKMTITLKFEDGSLGTVHYFANGSKKFPKERVEIFSEGRILTLDNFRVLKGYQWPGFRKKRLWRQNKGHVREISEFIYTIEHGRNPLIPWEELEEVTRATFEAVEKARNLRESSHSR